MSLRKDELPTLEPELSDTTTSVALALPANDGAYPNDGGTNGAGNATDKVIEIDLESSEDSSLVRMDEELESEPVDEAAEEDSDDRDFVDESSHSESASTCEEEAEESIHEDCSCPTALQLQRHANSAADQTQNVQETPIHHTTCQGLRYAQDNCSPSTASETAMDQCSGVDEYDLDDEMIEDDFYTHHHVCVGQDEPRANPKQKVILGVSVDIRRLMESPSTTQPSTRKPMSTEVHQLVPRKKKNKAAPSSRSHLPPSPSTGLADDEEPRVHRLNPRRKQ